MNTQIIITLHDYVHTAVGEALFPLRKSAVIASKSIGSCSDFEGDCKNKKHPASMVVCSFPYTGKRGCPQPYKLKIQTEEWVKILSIMLGYRVLRYVSVLAPVHGAGRRGKPGYCIKTVASVSRGDGRPLDVKTVCEDMSRVLSRCGIMPENGIVISHCDETDFRPLFPPRKEGYSPNAEASANAVKAKNVSRRFTNLEEKLATEVALGAARPFRITDEQKLRKV